MTRNRVFTKVAHDDHGVSEEQVDFVMTHPDLLERAEGSFILEVLAIPSDLGTAPSSLYGPAAGDASVGEDVVFYQYRGTRRGPSRLIESPDRPANNLVVVGIRGGVCFTMYGTQSVVPSPREPWDARDEDEFNRSLLFWNQHALAERVVKPARGGEPPSWPGLYRESKYNLK